MSFVTQGIGLSNTLGAFLAGLLLAETRYHYQIEADIAPFRGLLLGFFFIDVGFSIDIQLLIKEAPKILCMLVALLTGKAGIITLLSMAFGVPFASAQQAGLLNAQAGEFAFVAFGISERLGLLSPQLTKILLTTVALSMAATPALGELGTYISNRLDEKAGMSKYVGKDDSAVEVKSAFVPDNFVFVCGYGRVGKMVCDMLDTKFVRYAAIDSSAEKAIEARNKGLPVFFGDINRPEVLKSFDVGSAMACVITIDDMTATNKAVISIKKSFPDLPLIVRAKDSQHRRRLETMFDDVLLTLPFGGAVLQKIGVSKPEIDAILESFRKSYMEDSPDFEGTEFDFMSSFNRRLPPSVEDEDEVQLQNEAEEEEEIVLKPAPMADQEVMMMNDFASAVQSEDDPTSLKTLKIFEAPQVKFDDLPVAFDENGENLLDYDKDGRPYPVPSSAITFVDDGAK
jgi:monovalent cation:H+ antiporter-2, CPA2 family